jgi:hypothetical protein
MLDTVVSLSFPRQRPTLSNKQTNLLTSQPQLHSYSPHHQPLLVMIYSLFPAAFSRLTWFPTGFFWFSASFISRLVDLCRFATHIRTSHESCLIRKSYFCFFCSFLFPCRNAQILTGNANILPRPPVHVTFAFWSLNYVARHNSAWNLTERVCFGDTRSVTKMVCVVLEDVWLFWDARKEGTLIICEISVGAKVGLNVHKDVVQRWLIKKFCFIQKWTLYEWMIIETLCTNHNKVLTTLRK